MKISTVNISFPSSLLKEIDVCAEHESRNRSDLLRTAARVYIERKKRLKAILNRARKETRGSGITPEDINKVISQVRRKKRAMLASRHP